MLFFDKSASLSKNIAIFAKISAHIERRFKKMLIFACDIRITKMLELQDCITKLADFKSAFAQKFGITKLGIFGSVARKENTENSDIDIVVEVKKPSLQLMYELKEALKQLFKCEVDLVRFRDSLRPLFKSNIQRDVIYV